MGDYPRFRLVPGACPHCKRNLNSATAVTGKEHPVAGDITLCERCGEWCVFTETLELRAPTDAEFDEIATDKDCRAVRGSWLALQRKNGKHP